MINIGPTERDRQIDANSGKHIFKRSMIGALFGSNVGVGYEFYQAFALRTQFHSLKDYIVPLVASVLAGIVIGADVGRIEVKKARSRLPRV